MLFFRRYKTKIFLDKDKNGNWQDGEPLFIDIEVWGDRAISVTERYGKGDLIHVEGSLRMDFWETDDGEKRSRVYIRLNSIQLLKKKSDGTEQVDEVNDDVEF